MRLVIAENLDVLNYIANASRKEYSVMIAIVQIIAGTRKIMRLREYK